MPPLARAFVKAAFLYFIAAFVLGALMALDGWLGLGRWLRTVYLSQLHLLVVGWITQLAIGVAYCIFPRFRKTQKLRASRLGRTSLGRLFLLECRAAVALPV